MGIKHAFMYVLARGIPSVISFVSLLIYTRLLPPTEYGVYALIMTYINLFNTVLFQWLRIGLLRFMPAFMENGDELVTFKSTVMIGFAMNMAVSVFIVFLTKFMLHIDSLLLEINVIVNLWLFAWFELNQTLYRTVLNPVKYGILTLNKALFSLVISVVLIKAFHMAEHGVLLGLLAGTLLSLIGVSYSQWRQIRWKKSDFEVLKQICRYGIPLTVTFSFAFIIQFSDRFFIGWLKGADAAGFYSAATDLANQTIYMIMMVINLGALPIAIQKYETEGEDAARDQLNTNFLFMFGISFPVVVFGILLSDSVTHILFNGAFRQYIGSILPYSLIGIFFLGLKAYYFDQSFQMGKKTLGQIPPVVAAAIVSVVLNLILIPAMGLKGAAISAVCSYLVSMVLSWYFGKTIFPLHLPMKDTLKLTCSTLIGGLALVPFLHSKGILPLLLSVSLASLVYVLLVWLFNVANIRDYVNRLQLGRKVKVKMKMNAE